MLFRTILKLQGLAHLMKKHFVETSDFIKVLLVDVFQNIVRGLKFARQ